MTRATVPRSGTILAAASARPAFLALLVLAVSGVVACIHPAFASPAVAIDLLLNAAPLAIVACGVLLVIVTGEIDISVGALAGLLAAAFGLLASPSHAGLHPALAVPLVVAMGVGLGAAAGAIVVFARVPSIIATLGLMSLYRGGTELLLGGEWITDLSPAARWLGTGVLLGVPVGLLAAALAAAWTALLLGATPLGRRLYALGSSPDAARLAGLRSRALKVFAFAAVGGLTALAVAVAAPRLAVIEANFGIGWELFVVTAVVVGGASIRGGRGGVPGVLLAVLLLSLVRTALVYLRLGDAATFWERSIQGAFILLAVLGDRASDHAAADAPALAPGVHRSSPGAHEAALAVFLALGLFASWRLDPAFVSPGTQAALISQSLELLLLVLPMTLVILTGGIDLSVGSVAALAAVVLGICFRAGAPMPLAAGAALAVGAACGLANGLLVSRLRVHPLVVTLATLAAFRGLAEGLSLGRPVSGFPDSFPRAILADFLGLPLPAWGIAAAALLLFLVLARGRVGRELYAIGLNETAARFAGIAVDRLRVLVYTLSGLAAALAAVLFVARRNTAKADALAGIELEVITAVLLGGVSIAGGRGTLLGALLGAVLIHLLRQFIPWHWQRDELVPLALGALLIGAVAARELLRSGASRA